MIEVTKNRLNNNIMSISWGMHELTYAINSLNNVKPSEHHIL